MMAPAHTRSPWSWAEGTAEIKAHWYGDTSVTVAQVTVPRWHEDEISGAHEAGSNAAFIVTAVNSHGDLVEALKECALQIAQTHNRKLTIGEQSALNAARSALSLAGVK